MAVLSFSFDTGDVPLSRIIEGVAFAYEYPEVVPDESGNSTIPNPESKEQFFESKIKSTILGAVRAAELTKARMAAESTITDITLT